MKNTKTTTWHRIPREWWEESASYTAEIDGVTFTINRGTNMTYYYYWTVSAEVNGKSVRLSERYNKANRNLTSLKDAKNWAAAHAAEIREMA